MGAESVDAANAGVQLNPGTADEAWVRGINALTLPGGIERSVLTVEEFRRDIDTKITSGGAYADLSFKGNMIKGDTKGQDQLKEWITNNTRITAIRFFEDETDFVTLDLANDPEGFFQVNKFLKNEAPKSGIFTVDVGMIVGGRVASYLAHKEGTELSFVADAGSGATVVSAGTDFVTAGFLAGQTIIIEGSASNDGSYIIDSVAAGTITLIASSDLISEASVTATKVHGGK